MCRGIGEYLSSKTGLIVINIFYVVVSFILIGVAAYGKGASIVNNMGIIGGIIACGVVLLILSLLGLFGVMRDHKAVMYCYTISLVILFIIQLGMSIACFAVPQDERKSLAQTGWLHSSNSTRAEAQDMFLCCGYNSWYDDYGHPSCVKVPDCCDGIPKEECCLTKEDHCTCPSCHEKIENALKKGLNIAGGLGMFFAVTQLLGIIFSSRFQQISCPCGRNRGY